MDNIDRLQLQSQLCFSLYACSKEVIKKSKTFLDKVDLTYTQYITMLVLWEKKEVNVKELGEHLFLDSGTLTPVLKKLELKKYITRKRSVKDERNLKITVTKKGMELWEEIKSFPESCAKKDILISDKELIDLNKNLEKLLKALNENN